MSMVSRGRVSYPSPPRTERSPHRAPGGIAMATPTPSIVLGRRLAHARREMLCGGRLEVVSPGGVRGAERVLLDALPRGLEGDILTVGSREGLTALALAAIEPGAQVTSFVLDAFDLVRTKRTAQANASSESRVLLRADLPSDGRWDWVILLVSTAGDARLNAELVREAREALRPNGKICAAVDGSSDRWLHDRILETFGAVTIHSRSRHGSVYVARPQPGHTVRPRALARAFEARLLGTTLALETRPGVFSHGELDEGTLALSENAAIEPTDVVVDLGCGSGALGLAAAARARLAVLVDSSVRAVQSAAASARRNGLEAKALSALTCDFSCLRDGAFDVALANPPYFGDFRIAELFAIEGRRVLRSGGAFHIVTKAPERVLEIVQSVFGSSSSSQRRGYAILSSRKA
jgi:16S rRNA G1207 methylase RsmC